MPWFSSWTSSRAVVVAGQPLLDPWRVCVGRSVVDHDELVDERREHVEHAFDGRLLVVRRHHGDAAGDGPPDGTRRSVIVTGGTPVLDSVLPLTARPSRAECPRCVPAASSPRRTAAVGQPSTSRACSRSGTTRAERSPGGVGPTELGRSSAATLRGCAGSASARPVEVVGLVLGDRSRARARARARGLRRRRSCAAGCRRRRSSAARPASARLKNAAMTQVVAHARPVGDAVAQDRVRHGRRACGVVAAEHLRRDLRRHVDVAVACRGANGVASSTTRPWSRRVDPHRARQDHPAGLGSRARPRARRAVPSTLTLDAARPGRRTRR